MSARLQTRPKGLSDEFEWNRSRHIHQSVNGTELADVITMARHLVMFDVVKTLISEGRSSKLTGLTEKQHLKLHRGFENKKGFPKSRKNAWLYLATTAYTPTNQEDKKPVDFMGLCFFCSRSNKQGAKKPESGKKP